LPQWLPVAVSHQQERERQGINPLQWEKWGLLIISWKRLEANAGSFIGNPPHVALFTEYHWMWSQNDPRFGQCFAATSRLPCVYYQKFLVCQLIIVTVLTIHYSNH
jgi:hypothetical protein